MSETQQPQVVAPLAVGELIDDRALESREEDAFRLCDIADEVLGVCRRAATPATIALYASWGSGKSSLGRILQSEFSHDNDIAYARFDALKYAETPLRRHFLSQVAAAFGIDDPKYSRDLYRSEKGTDFKLTMAGAKRLAAMLVGAIIAVIAGLTVFAVLAAAIESGHHRYWHNLAQTLRGSGSGVILSATLLTALLAFLSQSLRVDTSTDAPSSSEEFERLFRELVSDVLKATKRSRLVVFIDELDRCSPDQVVSVLETLRTFLEVDGCVFIVAADQQALERAATEASRQATPANPGNPYYSAGSAYLDKIFQYQFSMPPLLPRRLSRFALDLIEDRPGVWHEIPNQPELVSVLIPTHVRSPRRVKALLNSFVLSFRLALTRSAEGALDPGVSDRASEIAKLVCLRIEFPLFAADLQLDARLPQLTLKLREHPDLTLEESGLHGVAPEAFARARAYANEELPVDEVIARTSWRDKNQESETTPAPDDASEATGTTPADADEEPTGDERQRVETNHARQLIRYLQRTRDIPGPGRDLVFLESSGAAFGLPGELAEQIEDDAFDGQSDRVARAIEDLTDDDYYAALRLLARLVVEAIGIEARNVLTSLFAVAGATSRSLDPVVDELLTAVASYRSGFDFKSTDLEGALRLSLERDTETAREVRATVIRRPEALTVSALRTLILQHATDLLDINPARISEVFTSHLANANPEDLVDLLAGLPLATSEAIADGLDDEKFGDEEFMTLAGTASAARPQGHEELGQLLLRALLGLATTDARNAAETVIPAFAPISSEPTVEAMLSGCRRRAIERWPVWLNALDPAAVATSDHSTTLFELVLQLWRRRFNPTASDQPATAEAFAAAADAVARLAPDGVPAPADRSADLLSSLPPHPVTAPAEVTKREEQLAALWSLADRKLMNPQLVGSLILDDLASSLSAAVPAEAVPPVSNYVVAQAALALGEADAVTDFATGITSSPWLDEPSRLLLRVRVAVAQARLGLATESSLSEADLCSLKEQGTPDALSAVADWIRGYRPDPETVTRLMDSETRSSQPIDSRLDAALAEIADGWSGEGKATWFTLLAPRYHANETTDALLRVGRAQEAEPGRIVAVLQELFVGSVNNDERERVLQLWAIARPASAPAQRTLADKIYIPMFGKGKDAIRLALAHFDLVQHMSGKPRDRIKRAIQQATQGDADLGRRADKRMREARWIKREKAWWEIF
jgi:hypothetical protein